MTTIQTRRRFKIYGHKHAFNLAKKYRKIRATVKLELKQTLLHIHYELLSMKNRNWLRATFILTYYLHLSFKLVNIDTTKLKIGLRNKPEKVARDIASEEESCKKR